MEATKEVLDKIWWEGVSVFPEDDSCLLVLLCRNEKECFDLIDLMMTNEFKFYKGEDDFDRPAFVLKFTKTNAQKYIKAGDNNIDKYFANGQIKYITTGFETDSKDIACHSERIEIGGFDYTNQN